MKRTLWWRMVVVAGLVISTGAALWGVHDLQRAHDCLNNGNYSANITEDGCQLRTDHGTVLIELNGPGFGLTLFAIVASTLFWESSASSPYAAGGALNDSTSNRRAARMKDN